MLLAELLERRQQITGVVENIVIFYNRKWNCSLRIGRTAQFAAAVYTHKKDDRVESIYANTRQCKHSGKAFNIGKFPLEKETGFATRKRFFAQIFETECLLKDRELFIHS